MKIKIAREEMVEYLQEWAARSREAAVQGRAEYERIRGDENVPAQIKAGVQVGVWEAELDAETYDFIREHLFEGPYLYIDDTEFFKLRGRWNRR